MSSYDACLTVFEVAGFEVRRMVEYGTMEYPRQCSTNGY